MKSWIRMMMPLTLVCVLMISPVFAQDADSDGVLDDADNCISVPNGPALGTCVKTVSGLLSGTGTTCLSDGGCTAGQTCDMDQGDGNANGKGDACECYADTNCDAKVNLPDLVLLKKEFQKSDCATEFCYANANGDGKVDLNDLVVMKAQFTKPDCTSCARPVGVLFAVHGGTDTVASDEYLWNSGVQQFSYDPNHSVYKLVIWNPLLWWMALAEESTKKFVRKYDFEFPLLEDETDPFRGITEEQLADMQAVLDSNTLGINFVSDWIAWMCGDCVEHLPYPRFIYYGPDGPGAGYNCTYCGEDELDGPWDNCDPDRYDVDGSVERLLKQGVYRIIMVDLTVGGVRFSKTYDIVEMSQKMLDAWATERGITIPLLWVNDYSDLMNRSYPTQPAGWTRSSIPALPTTDSEVLLNGSPNPVASDADLATLQVEAIEAGMSGSVSDADTGVILMNHALHDNNEVFDPKMDDTVVLNENIKSQLRALHPTMDADNIIGARMGIKVDNPETPDTRVERTREMRGEDLGYQYLYAQANAHLGTKVFPSGGSDPFGIYHPWGYLYWDALDYLITRGVQHIVIGFPQITTSSVLDMVEFPNQIAKEIGTKNWLKHGTGDPRYPGGGGYPFAEYWGNWVDTDCAMWEIAFENGTAPIQMDINDPAVELRGSPSGAKGIINRIIVDGGSWTPGDPAYGTFVLTKVVGNFTDTDTLGDSKGAPGYAEAVGSETQTVSENCCFEMGGCADDPLPRPYPPPRITPLAPRRGDMDPSLAYDLCEYGHLGYDPGIGQPDPNNPVQNQYDGTWEMYAPPDGDDGVGELLAKHVINAIIKPMVYLSNGEKEDITEGESVTFQAHVVTGGKSPYAYAWSTNKNGSGWTPVGGNSSSWTWNSASGEAGTYSVRCTVTDSQSESGAVMWEGFEVSAP